MVSGTGRKVRVDVRDRVPLGDSELDDALTTVIVGLLGTKVRTLVDLMPRSSQILRRLVGSGAVVEESRTRLGLTLRRYTTTPATGRDELVERLRSDLLGDDERAILSAVRETMTSD